MRYSFVFLLLLNSILTHKVNAKPLPQAKYLQVKKIVGKPPIIDGYLTDSVWLQAGIASGFSQYVPNNGGVSTETTEVQFLYDDQAVYIAAMMKDENPKEIYKELSKRDDIDGKKTDYFSVIINPYDDGVNAVEFMVSAAGVQEDKSHNGSNEDVDWDAVWTSKVAILPSGWSVEMRIPFSALRFPNKEHQTWGVNYIRQIKRKNEVDSWSPMDNGIQGISNQLGQIAGIANIKPPVRLAFYPYLTGYYEQSAERSEWKGTISGGMDVKYGISEGFTLDMSLIPDFGQVQSDDQVYNLSPFEVQYTEKRPFFIEGMDLFKRGGIFYSRRIGGTPVNYNSVYDSCGNNEIVERNPVETPMINATKIFGRTSSGLGLGLLNAMTRAVDAVVRDTITNNTRNVETQSFTNYNMAVVDHTLRNGSHVSLANSWVISNAGNFNSTVTAGDMLLRDRTNSYQLAATGVYSRITETNPNDGFKYYIKVEKTGGNFTWGTSQNTESKNYNPNSLGYLMAPNEFSQNLFLGYRTLKPTKLFRSIGGKMAFYNTCLYSPRLFTARSFSLNFSATDSRYNFSFGGGASNDIKKEHDYYEPREEGRMLLVPKTFSYSFWISSDYRRFFALDVSWGGHQGEDYGMRGSWFHVSPRFRLSDKVMLVYSFSENSNINSIGWVAATENPHQIVFGRRDIATFTNVLEGQFVFSNKSYVSLRARHYVSQLDYKQYYDLQTDGNIKELDYNDNNDFTYTNFYLDLAYQWNFAPGSLISVVWKNSVAGSVDYIRNSYWSNVNDTWSINQSNSFSVKLLYYLDYQSILGKNNT